MKSQFINFMCSSVCSAFGPDSIPNVALMQNKLRHILSVISSRIAKIYGEIIEQTSTKLFYLGFFLPPTRKTERSAWLGWVAQGSLARDGVDPGRD